MQSKVLIVGFNGPPRSYKDSRIAETIEILQKEAPQIAPVPLGFTDFTEDFFVDTMTILTGIRQNYESAKDAVFTYVSNEGEVRSVTGREVLIGVLEGLRAVIPFAPAHITARKIEEFVESEASLLAMGTKIVFFLSNVGFDEEYEMIQDLPYQFQLVYMSEKRKAYEEVSYAHGDIFKDDSRVCLYDFANYVDPSPELLAGYIQNTLK